MVTQRVNIGTVFLLTVGVSAAYWGVSHLIWSIFHQYGMLPAPIWPAAALALVAAMRYGARVAPGLFLGAVLANWQSLGAPVGIALGIGVMNTVAPILCARMIVERTRTRVPFDSIAHVAVFALAGVLLHAALTATGGITSLVIGGRLPVEAAPTAWLRWWIAHASGVMLFAPALLLWWEDRSPRPRQGRSLELAVVGAVGLAAAAAIFFAVAPDQHALIGLPFLLMAPLAWISVRFDLRETLTFFPLLIVIAAAGTLNGAGPFHLTGNPYPLVALGLMILAFSVVALMLGALVAERRRDERDLKLAASVYHATQESILVTDPGGIILSVNPGFSQITGYSEQEALGQTPRLLKSRHHHDDFYKAMWKSLNETGRWEGEIYNRRKNGEVFIAHQSIDSVLGEDGKPARYVAVFNDVTDLRRQEKEIRHLAYHDPLTGLPNRILLRDRLEQSLSRARRKGNKVALLFLDLDNFKVVNDSLGHEVGDQLLIEVAKWLTDLMRESDTVARIGGDEFVIIVESAFAPLRLAQMVERIIEEIDRPMTLGGHKIQVSTSIGVGVFPDDGEDTTTLLKNADTAMYAAKEAGRNAYRFFTPSLNERAMERLTLEHEMRQGLRDGDFVIYVQPKVCLRNGGLGGAEVLVRWEHPEKGIVSPVTFIPLAEETGLILPLGDSVLRQAAALIAELEDRGMPVAPLAVNVSARQLQDPDFVERVESLIEEFGIPADRLELELTESTLIDDPDGAARTLSRIRAMGVTIALDDFGTGYSSLSILPRLPIEILKIDRSFIAGLETDPRSSEVVKSIIAMAGALNLTCVAEGVENPNQLSALQRLGCFVAQGYLIARPMPRAAFLDWVTDWIADRKAGGVPFLEKYGLPSAPADDTPSVRVTAKRPS